MAESLEQQRARAKSILQGTSLGKRAPTGSASGRSTNGFPTQEPPEIKKSWFDKLAKIGQGAQDLSVGAAKGFASTVKNNAGMVSGVFNNPTVKRVTRPFVPLVDAFGPAANFVKNAIPDAAVTTRNNTEKVGFGAEQVAEVLIPTGTGAKVLSKTKPVVNLIEKYGGKYGRTAAKQFDDLVTKIVQGETKDIPQATQALSKIPAADVKSYDDLSKISNEKIRAIKSKLDDVLNTKPEPQKNLSINTKVGNQTVSHNYVNDALEQLNTFYTKINDPVQAAEIRALKEKASKAGLTLKEINDLAVRHGQDLSGFNLNGELASGLKKQAAENTRAGLKGTARQIFNDPIYNAADDEMSALIRVRKLSDDMVEKVNELRGKIEERGLVQKLAHMIGKGVNIATGGLPRELFSSLFIERGRGAKTFNPIDLEANLQKNLKKLQGIINSKGSDEDILKKMQNFLNQPKPVTTPRVIKPTRIETDPRRLLTSGGTKNTGDFTSAVRLPSKSGTAIAEEQAGRLKKIGGKFSRRTSSTTQGGYKFTTGKYNAVGVGAGFEKDENGKLKFDSKKAALGVLGVAAGTKLSGKNLLKKVPKLAQDDRQRMVQFIDNIRLKGKTDVQLEVDARRLAEYFKLNPNQSNAKIANALEKVVAAYDFLFKPKYKGDFNKLVK